MTHIELHTKAMQYAEEAMVANMKGDIENAEKLLIKAYKFEADAAYAAEKIEEKDIIRYVIFNSAANLAMEIKNNPAARRLAKRGITESTPHDIKLNLNEILKKIKKIEEEALRKQQQLNQKACDHIKNLIDTKPAYYNLPEIVTNMGGIFFEVHVLFRRNYNNSIYTYYNKALYRSIQLLKADGLVDSAIAKKLGFPSEVALLDFYKSQKHKVRSPKLNSYKVFFKKLVRNNKTY